MAKNATPEAPANATPETPVMDLSGLKNAEEHQVTAAEVNVPEEIKMFVDHGHEFWQGQPKKWRSVNLANNDTVGFVIRKSRNYAKATDRTFRVNKQATTDTRLVYKVTDKFQNQGTEDE